MIYTAKRKHLPLQHTGLLRSVCTAKTSVYRVSFGLFASRQAPGSRGLTGHNRCERNSANRAVFEESYLALSRLDWWGLLLLLLVLFLLANDHDGGLGLGLIQNTNWPPDTCSFLAPTAAARCLWTRFRFCLAAFATAAAFIFFSSCAASSAASSCCCCLRSASSEARAEGVRSAGESKATDTDGDKTLTGKAVLKKGVKAASITLNSASSS